MIPELVATAGTILVRAVATVALGTGLSAVAIVGVFALIRARITARHAPATDDYQEAA